jgi:hypothetical protein
MDVVPLVSCWERRVRAEATERRWRHDPCAPSPPTVAFMDQ